MITFFIYTFAGSLFMLVAFVYLYAKTGSFDWNTLQSATLSVREANWIYLAFFLAYAIKIPVFPFHTWQANTYEKSPAIGTMLLSGIMLKMRSEEHTSELQSRPHLVCRLLLEKKK